MMQANPILLLLFLGSQLVAMVFGEGEKPPDLGARSGHLSGNALKCYVY